jgi:iron complex transport system permease protein
MRENVTSPWVLLLFLMLLLFIANLATGSVSIPPAEILSILVTGSHDNPAWTEIVLNFRLTKALTCVLAGSALALAGLQMQTLFRNPLAGPDVLGLSAGASLAVAILFMAPAATLGIAEHLPPLVVSVAATAGSLTVFLIMILVARRLPDPASLLIVGLMVGALAASVVSVLQYISKAEHLQVFVIWTMGSLGGLNWNELLILALALVVGSALAFSAIKPLNAWLLGERYALSLGINTRRTRLIAILSASVLTGAVTAFCGPIAFVGLAVPHLTRLLIRTHNHKALIPAVALGGAALMLFCDIVAQLPGSTYILPINALTALIGAPVVIWIILQNKSIRI